MNPFDLRGPEFLAFYAALGALGLAALWVVRRISEPLREGPWVREPYLVAALRGGRDSVFDVATFSLLARGALEHVEGRQVRATQGFRGSLADPLERSLVSFFSVPHAYLTARSDRNSKAAADVHVRALEQRGLVPDAAQLRSRAIATALVLAVLLGVAAVKVVVALARGRSNVLFLIALAAICAWAAVAYLRRPRTAAGDALLQGLQHLFGPRARVRVRAERPREGGADAELLLVAAMAGVVGGPFKSAPTRASKRGVFGGNSNCSTLVS